MFRKIFGPKEVPKEKPDALKEGPALPPEISKIADKTHGAVAEHLLQVEASDMPEEVRAWLERKGVKLPSGGRVDMRLQFQKSAAVPEVIPPAPSDAAHEPIAVSEAPEVIAHYRDIVSTLDRLRQSNVLTGNNQAKLTRLLEQFQGLPSAYDKNPQWESFAYDLAGVYGDTWEFYTALDRQFKNDPNKQGAITALHQVTEWLEMEYVKRERKLFRPKHIRDHAESFFEFDPRDGIGTGAVQEVLRPGVMDPDGNMEITARVVFKKK